MIGNSSLLLSFRTYQAVENLVIAIPRQKFRRICDYRSQAVPVGCNHRFSKHQFHGVIGGYLQYWLSADIGTLCCEFGYVVSFQLILFIKLI